jgi:Immunoglobulin V-set domain
VIVATAINARHKWPLCNKHHKERVKQQFIYYIKLLPLVSVIAVASPSNKSRDTLPQGWLNDQAVLTASNPAQSLLLETILQDDPRSARSDNFVALPPRPTRVSANVGHSRVLECDVRYTSGVYVQHIVTWRKQGLEAPIFILFDGYPPRIDVPYQGRLRSVGPASVELSDIRLSDEGWYECSVLFMDRPDGTTNDNGTWIHLSVNG